MKVTRILPFFILVTMLVTACNYHKPTSVPTSTAHIAPEIKRPAHYLPFIQVPALPSPTPTPPVSLDPTWDKVQANRKIVFGTSADYRPFEYYDSNFQIVGFDAALARDLAARLGLQVELVDMPFEALTTALQFGQIDAAIAAISVTQERQSIVDFSSVYYSGYDSILARQGSGIGKILSPYQLAQYRVGVQRGTTYEAWLQKNLVSSSLMPAGSLLVYEKPEHAVRDLKESRIDLVLMGAVPAQDYLLSGGLEIVGEGLNVQLFAIALPKGAPTFQTALNQKLAEMTNDGTLARYAAQYLQIDLSKVPQLPTPTPYPTAIIPTATPVPCYDSMVFIGDVEIADGTQINPNAPFSKAWRIRNSGTCNWDGTYRLEFVQGSRMDGNSVAIQRLVRPGELYDVRINQRAPSNPGNYQGIWQLLNQRNVPFGERLWVRINVPGLPPPTAIPPTVTPIPPVQPTLAPGPEIYFLNVSAFTVNQNDLLVVNWSFSSAGVVSARLNRTNPDGSTTLLMGGADVSPQGRYEDIMAMPGTYTYSLNVSSEFGRTSVKTAVANVLPAAPSVDFRNSDWILERFINPIRPDFELTPFEGTELTVRFNADGSVTGYTGCNPFSTTYQTFDRNGIVVSENLTTGRAFCAENVMGQEALYLDLLTSVQQVEMSGNMLIFRSRNIAPERNDMIVILVYYRR